MAKDDRRYDSDEEMAAQDDERQENGEEAGDDEEYEIEQILEAKYNAFPNVSFIRVYSRVVLNHKRVLEQNWLLGEVEGIRDRR